VRRYQQLVGIKSAFHQRMMARKCSGEGSLNVLIEAKQKNQKRRKIPKKGGEERKYTMYNLNGGWAGQKGQKPSREEDQHRSGGTC